MLSPFHPLQLTLGLIIWSLYFVAVYAGMSIVCSDFAPPQSNGPVTWLNAALLALTIIVVLGLLFQAWRGWRVLSREGSSATDNNRFIVYVGVAVYLVAALATVLTGAPLLVLTPCI